MYYRSRISYWSLSPFSYWLRNKFNIPKMESGTKEEWDAYEEKWKLHPVYRFTEWLDNVQDVVYFIPDLYNSIRIYVKNRFFDKLHYLQTNLKRILKNLR